jgi:VWFA-related protein
MAHISRRCLLASALPLLQAQDDVTFRTGVKVVNVLATVKNKSGERISSLEKDDFLLTENAHPQDIRYFTRQTDLPLTIGLMFDTSMSQEKVLNAQRGASMRFFDQVIRPDKDRAFILQFDMNFRLRQPLTSSLKDLGEALSYVDTPTREELINSHANGGTMLYDSIIEGARILKPQQGRKALLVLTDGIDFGSDASIDDAIEAAERSDTLIYSILFAGSGRGARVLTRMAHDTGGGYFEVSKKQTIESVFAAIEQELRSQYSIGYVSNEPVRLSEWRKIGLTTRRPGLVVQARNRYWAQR